MVGGTPTTTRRWIEGTVELTVSDGRLTVSNSAGANNKVKSLDIEAPA